MYYCEYPNCNYQTDIRSKINYHHIIPKSKSGSNKNFNRIWLCPNCHTSIYIPEETKGIHSKFNDNSIIILGWKLSTAGKILEYKLINSNEILYYLKEKL
jgi:5-methylcytosine-specific restriction endonuclease McrA